MIKAMLLLIILSLAALGYFIIIVGSRSDKRDFMHFEKCDHKSCSWCLDKEQCKRGD